MELWHGVFGGHANIHAKWSLKTYSKIANVKFNLEIKSYCGFIETVLFDRKIFHNFNVQVG